MRTLPLSILLGLALVACQQTTQSNTTAGSTSTVKTSTTTDTVNVPAVDTTKTEHAKEELKQAGDKAKVDLRKAAAATGTALEKAGKKLEEKANEKKH